MRIILNGEPRDIPDSTTAIQLIALLKLEGRRLAMEVNHEVVPRSRFGEFILHEGDRVEIVHAIGGG